MHQLGSTGLLVSSLGMGCGRLGSRPVPADLRAGLWAVSLAMARGINFFDTADAYGRGLSERTIGRALDGRRDRAVIATKCGMLKTPAALLRAVSNSGPLPDVRSARDLLSSRRCYEPRYVKRAAEASLRRLGSDYIDLFLLHSPPPDVLREGRFLDALGQLQSSGKIVSWGVSAYRCDDALLALELPGMSAIEVELNICETAALARVIPEAIRRGVGVIARQPLASGRIEEMRRAAAEAGSREELTTPMRVRAAALQFDVWTEGVATTIVGMTKPDHVAANIEAVTADRLSADETADVQKALCERS
jgi:aryl-alcohol dehydrogenase-like predicted oxidoreductase